MTITVITKPLDQPVTLARIKQHLRIDHNADDDYLTELADAATLHVEAHIGHSLIDRTLRQYVDEMPPEYCVVLKAWPVSGITVVTGYDGQGDPQIMPPASYELRQGNKAVAVQFTRDANPTDFVNGLEIDFVAGHGESELDVPSNITRTILVLIAHWYEIRGAVDEGDATGIIPASVERLLAPVRRVRL